MTNTMTMTEMLAAIIGGKQAVPTAEALLKRYQSLPRMADAPIEELTAFDGAGKATAERLKVSLSLSKQMLRDAAAKETIKSAAHVM